MPSRITARLALAGGLALLLNSVYLWAFADPTVVYFVQVALHPVLGLTVAGLVAWLFASRQWLPRPMAILGLAFSAAGLAGGVGILLVGATTPHRHLVDVHVAASAFGAALLVASFWRTGSSHEGAGCASRR
jgi:hypothetical protein